MGDMIQQTTQLRLVHTKDGEPCLHMGLQTSDGPECWLHGVKLQQYWRSLSGGPGQWIDVPLEVESVQGQ